MTIKQLRIKEKKVLEKFVKACQAVVNADAELWELHNQLSREGEQSIQPFPSKPEVVRAAKDIVSRDARNQRVADELANPKPKPKPTGRTFGLKK